MEKIYIKKAELVEAISVSEKLIERWMKQGLIPFIRINRTIRFDLPKVKLALEKFEHKSAL